MRSGQEAPTPMQPDDQQPDLTVPYEETSVFDLQRIANAEATEVLAGLDVVKPFGTELVSVVPRPTGVPNPGKTRYHSSTGRDGRNVWDYAVGQ